MGGLPPGEACEDEEFILKDSQRVIEAYHDTSRGSMVQIVLASCSPFSVTGDLLVNSAELTRQLGCRTPHPPV
jgi:cytosine/adenosine deaminase-related metal-dependent hydrolase